jgi:dihydropteroate synthase
VSSPRARYSIPLPSGSTLALGERCLVMGILNVTPDSFADSRHAIDAPTAIDAALQMAAAGADLIDIGGESTRPGATPIDASEEQTRIVPVIRGLAGQLKIPISIDTYKADVAHAALDAGASIVNDISGLRFEPRLARVVADARAALVLMHSRGTVTTLHAEPMFRDLLGEIVDELRGSIRIAGDAGVAPERLILDPGIGFAKRPPHSYGVLAHLPDLASALDRPLLVGPSRKSFMREAVGGRPAAERDWGTAAAVTAAVLAGVHIVRVHAVAEMVQVVRVAEQIRRHG